MFQHQKRKVWTHKSLSGLRLCSIWITNHHHLSLRRLMHFCCEHQQEILRWASASSFVGKVRRTKKKMLATSFKKLTEIIIYCFYVLCWVVSPEHKILDEITSWKLFKVFKEVLNASSALFTVENLWVHERNFWWIIERFLQSIYFRRIK